MGPNRRGTVAMFHELKQNMIQWWLSSEQIMQVSVKREPPKFHLYYLPSINPLAVAFRSYGLSEVLSEIQTAITKKLVFFPLHMTNTWWCKVFKLKIFLQQKLFHFICRAKFVLLITSLLDPWLVIPNSFFSTEMESVSTDYMYVLISKYNVSQNTCRHKHINTNPQWDFPPQLGQTNCW